MSSASTSGPADGGVDELDDRLHRFAHLGVGNADDGDVGHPPVAGEDVLGFLGVDVHPPEMIMWAWRSVRYR